LLPNYPHVKIYEMLDYFFVPKVQLADVIELDEHHRREDDDGGGDEQEDVADVQELLILCCLPLHHRQRRPLRPRPEHRHGDDNSEKLREIVLQMMLMVLMCFHRHSSPLCR